MSNLVIVESPAKSQTIKKFLWEWFEVKASFGHVVDLPAKELGVDVKNNFQPKYVVSPDKTKVLSELKSIAKKSDKIWIATDEDREWEAIGRHVANQLGLDISKTARIVFHEITKEAIDHAVKNPRTIDMHLVDAQQARRVLDRLVWFELSPVLWQKVKWWLSAWRVQSVAVRLIVDREKEIKKFQPAWPVGRSESFFKVIWNFTGDENKEFKAELSKDIPDQKGTESFLNEIKNSKYQISEIEVKPWKKTPSAPFTTSTLQQEASRKLGFSVARTMQVAQKLYEAWNITYMRTDSVNLSQTAIDGAKKEIIKLYWEKYSNPTNYITKSKWSQEAHECIRPSHMENPEAWNDANEKRLYELIWKRTIASQMAPAITEKTKATIDISDSKLKFIATWEVIKFDWFLKVYFEWTDDENENGWEWILPVLKKWEILDMQSIVATQKFKNHPPRYTEASLVKKLEELWIWRPSTYAPTISTVQKRWYVVKEDRIGTIRKYIEITLSSIPVKGEPVPVMHREGPQSGGGFVKIETKEQNTWAEKNKLFPTDTWNLVTDFLMEHFKDIMDYNFTAQVEQDFDEIAEWKIKWNKMISEFYWPFHEGVKSTLKNAERTTGARELGKDPKTWKPVIAKMWRYWAMIQIGITESEEKPTFAGMPMWKSIDTVTLQEALKAFDWPQSLWEYKWEKITTWSWRFGPYLKYKNMFVSVRPNSWFDVATIKLDEAIGLIEQKFLSDAQKNINTFDYPAKDGTSSGKKIEVLNWHYWPYMKYNSHNFRIPKWWKDATSLTLEDCLEIIWWKKSKSEEIKSEKKSAKKESKKVAKPKKEKVEKSEKKPKKAQGPIKGKK